MKRDTIFVSYARKDGASRDELIQHLEVILGDPPSIRIFADSSIDVGDKWHARIITVRPRKMPAGRLRSQWNRRFSRDAGAISGLPVALSRRLSSYREAV